LPATETSWVVNASPLILFGKLGHLDLLEGLALRLVVPLAVVDEIAVGVSADAGGGVLDWARAHEASNLSVPSSILGWDLGAGETQVITHCLAGGYRAVLDDAEARAAAKVHGVPLTGTLGVILRARQAGLIPEARPLVEQLIKEGSWLAPDLVRQALQRLGE